MLGEDATPDEAHAQAKDTEPSRSSRFRFKSKRKHRDEDELHGNKRHSKRRHRHDSDRHERYGRHRSHRQSQSPRASRLEEEQPLDPDAAFRESLFDALADDEGAAYWEGVYGQPIHIYPNTKSAGDANGTAQTGELEQMDEEEYAAYVRSRMWEKSHQHIIEERQRREDQRRRDRERVQVEQEQSRSNTRAFDDMIDAALRRGQRRKTLKSWEQAWKEYVGKWERLIEASKQRDSAATSSRSSDIVVPWPVNSGRREDVNKDAVRDFFLKHDKNDLLRLLKVERVQWHPDKMQQRLGVVNLDDATLQSVTAVFQIVDDLWTEIKQA